MRATVGTMTANANVVDSNNIVNEEFLERVVNIVMERLRQRQEMEEISRRESDIPERMSAPNPYNTTGWV